MPLFAPDEVLVEDVQGDGFPIPPIIATVEIPPGCETADCVPPCKGVDCDPCSEEGVECEIQTGVIGHKGFGWTQIDPNTPPFRQRVWFTEEIDLSID